MNLPDPLEIATLTEPPIASLRVPGSKSLTNRALVMAALAASPSTIGGALVADDTAAMIDVLGRLGARIGRDDSGDLQVTPIPTFPLEPFDDVPIEVDARLSGTTSRFVLPLAALTHRRVRLDGREGLRLRPIDPLVDALRVLGADIVYEAREGGLPLLIDGRGFIGGEVTVEGSASSQFLSALLLSGASMPKGLTVEVAGELVARPFIDMTIDVLAEFGVQVTQSGRGRFVVSPQRAAGITYRVEPDATAASYFFSAAAITGGTVTMEGLGKRSRQGDMAFVDVLARMGATVDRREDSTVVRGGALVGIDVDLGAIPDTAQTLAAVAAFAEGPTRVRGVDFIRGHETDRIKAVVTEARRAGLDATETDDGFVITPAPLHPTVIETYGDHRMAMSFALLGLRVPGISIADPGVVAKTYPGYFDDLAGLATLPSPGGR